MGLSRSTFYDMPSAALQASELLARIGAICDEFECSGYRRVGAALRHQGIVVNNKRLRRLMREHGLRSPSGAGCRAARKSALLQSLWKLGDVAFSVARRHQEG
jgi:transposase InsO family protein